MDSPVIFCVWKWVLILAGLLFAPAWGWGQSLEPLAPQRNPAVSQPAKTEVKILEDKARGIPLLLGPESAPIDLPAALRLAGVKNPQILIARQRVVESVAQRMLFASMILPSLNFGGSYDVHNGNLQQSGGNILRVDRNSLYLGLGAYAIAAGTVNIPGLVYDLTVSEALFNGLSALQTVQQAKFNVRVRENEITRDVAVSYNRLLGAAGRSAVRRNILEQADEVKRLTSAFAKAGKGRQSDAERASSDYRLMHSVYLEAEGNVLLASARLAQLLCLPPDVRLCPLEKRLLPVSLVPPPICLRELIAIGLLNRPELGYAQATIRLAMLKLTAAKLLPFSPQLIIGLSYGSEGGGSNLVHEPEGTEPFAKSDPRFGNFNDRLDFDVVWFWSIQNFGVRNLGLCREAKANLKIRELEMIGTMDMVREQVTSAHTQSQARFARMLSAEKAIETIRQSFEADLKQIKGGEGLPIELLDSLRLLARAQEEYVDAIIEFNRAQIELYFALGQPPADYLARPAPDVVVTPAVPAIPAAEKLSK